jgi:hypothetical protein
MRLKNDAADNNLGFIDISDQLIMFSLWTTYGFGLDAWVWDGKQFKKIDEIVLKTERQKNDKDR